MPSPSTPRVPRAAAPPSPSAPPSFPETYERVLVAPLFAPWAEALLDRVPIAPGARVLDVACGTGIVARLAARRLGGHGRVVGVDHSPSMLAVARDLEPTIDWREDDAAALPVAADERFDVALCHQGVQFFADRLAAVTAMRRALVPGGHLGIGVWRALEENGLFHDLGRVAERFVGPVDDARHAFGNADALARLLADAGCSDVRVEPTARETRFAVEPAVLARLNAMAVIGRTAAGRALSDAERAELATTIAAASLPAVARYDEGGVIAFRTSANVATARA